MIKLQKISMKMYDDVHFITFKQKPLFNKEAIKFPMESDRTHTVKISITFIVRRKINEKQMD